MGLFQRLAHRWVEENVAFAVVQQPDSAMHNDETRRYYMHSVRTASLWSAVSVVLANAPGSGTSSPDLALASSFGEVGVCPTAFTPS